MRGRPWYRWTLALTAVGLTLAVLPARAGTPTTMPAVQVLSNRADLVSGGDALVQVDPAGSRVSLNGRDVTRAFARRANGRYQGLVTGLRNGPNTVVADTGRHAAGLTVTNHPTSGPVFSGPQVQPWYCLPGALDKQCRRPVTYSFQYKSSVTGSFSAYDPKAPPGDLATVTTDQGKTVPYVVRVEAGTMDRSAYSIAVLYDGTKPFTRWTGPPAWNHKVYATHGGGCGGFHTEGAAPPVVNDQALGKGFAVMSAALEDSVQNCNVAVQAESVMMAKEHLIEAYGDVRYLFGFGSSGGSLAELQMANAYPGLYDGLTVGSTFPDITYNDLLDCTALHRYFDSPTKWAPGVVWTEPSMAAASGKASTSVCRVESLPFGPEDFSNMFNPTDPQWCNMQSHEPEKVYNATTNPRGVRCSLQDYMVNLFGTRGRDRWGAVEKQIRRGFANRPYDTVGVQYGLRALQAGSITPAQFVDLNAKIGAVDIDYGSQPQRVTADPGSIAASYRSGVVDEANNLDLVPIIDVPNYAQNYDIHDKWKSWALRARLDAANGHHDNHVIWHGPGRDGMAFNADDGRLFTYMDTWLSTMEADHRALPRELKVRKDKPKDLQDRCDLPTPDVCNTLLQHSGSTRWGAGESIATDVIKCRLRPLARADYGTVQFSDADWAALRTAFPTGVCDWSRPGVSQQPTIGWQTYDHTPGGRPLGQPPRSEPLS